MLRPGLVTESLSTQHVRQPERKRLATPGLEHRTVSCVPSGHALELREPQQQPTDSRSVLFVGQKHAECWAHTSTHGICSATCCRWPHFMEEAEALGTQRSRNSDPGRQIPDQEHVTPHYDVGQAIKDPPLDRGRGPTWVPLMSPALCTQSMFVD